MISKCKIIKIIRQWFKRNKLQVRNRSKNNRLQNGETAEVAVIVVNLMKERYNKLKKKEKLRKIKKMSSNNR